MGVYARKDSRFWWMLLEGTAIRQSTNIPIGTGYARKDSRREAEDIYIAAMADLARGTWRLPKQRPVITFRAHAQWYAEHVAAHHRGKRRALSMIRNLTAWFGDTYLHALTPQTIEEWKTARAAQVQPVTVNRELDMLKPLLRAAVPTYLETSPAEKAKRFTVRRFAPITILSASAETALLDAATPLEKAFVLLGLDALMRLSDVRTFTAAQNHGATIDVPNSKTLAPFRLPASTRLQAALKALTPQGGYYFAKQRNRGPQKGQWRAYSEAEAFDLFADLCRRAGVTRGREAGGITFHSLRHTGASRASRVSKATAVMKLGGWASLKQLARYDHPDDSDLIRAVEAIGGSRPTHGKGQKRKNPPISERVSGESWRGRRDIGQAEKPPDRRVFIGGNAQKYGPRRHRRVE